MVGRKGLTYRIICYLFPTEMIHRICLGVCYGASSFALKPMHCSGVVACLGGKICMPLQITRRFLRDNRE